MREIIRYQIEARHPVTGYWEVLRMCGCHYERESVMRKLLWFTWFKPRIINRHEAELKCRKEAMTCRWAYEKDHEELRVVVVILIHDYTDKSVVWENGEWKDC